MQLTISELLKLLKKDDINSDALYKLHVHPEIKDNLNKVITILLRAYFGIQGEDTIIWWMFDSNPKIIYDSTTNETLYDLTTEEELYKYLCELSNIKNNSSTIN